MGRLLPAREQFFFVHKRGIGFLHMPKKKPLKRKTSRIVNSRFAKSGEYRGVISTIEALGRCPFCPDNFLYHKKPILKKINGWRLTENSWPYKNARKHFIIVAPVHKEQLIQLTESDVVAIFRLSQWAIKKFNIRGGALTLRFGESDVTGATVSHLHAHLIYPSLDKKGHAKTVNFPIG
jgi:ATP adenylyltransferase